MVVLNKIKKKYDLFLSIGAACPCTEVLRKNNLQYKSYPFDWLFGSDYNSRIKILVDNFTNWLNQEDLVLIGKRENPLPCNIYKNTRTNIIFNHDFKINTQLEESFNAVKEKYDRRIKRVLDNLKDSKNILLVYIEIPTIKQDVSNEKLIEGYNVLKNKYTNKNIDILYIFNSPEIQYSNCKITRILSNIIRLDFDYSAHNELDPYAVNMSVLNDLFKNNYKISLKLFTFKDKIKFIYKNSIGRYLKNIFSVKNSHDKKHKIFKIFGIKLKFKNNYSN